MIDGENLFDQQVKSNVRACDNIQKVAVGQGDDYTTASLLDYNNFNKQYKMIATDLNKQQVLDADPKPLQQINFTRNLDQPECATMFFFIKEVKETILNHPSKKIFHKELEKYCNFVLFNYKINIKWLNITF